MEKKTEKQKKNYETAIKVFELFMSAAGLIIGIVSMIVDPNNFVIAVSVIACQFIAVISWAIAYHFMRKSKENVEQAEEEFDAWRGKNETFLANIIRSDADSILNIGCQCLQLQDEKQIYRQYNSYVGGVIRNQDKIMSEYLKAIGKERKLSFSLKLFTERQGADVVTTTAQVFTAFRDEDTYKAGVREVGKLRHELDGNGDFVQCLTQSYYIKNDISPDAKDYFSTTWPASSAYYNSTVVVPIYVGEGAGKKRFGYFCCDTMNTEHGVAVFDENTANMMRTAAYGIGLFLERAYSCYETAGNGDFLTYLNRKCEENYRIRSR